MKATIPDSLKLLVNNARDSNPDTWFHSVETTLTEQARKIQLDFPELPHFIAYFTALYARDRFAPLAFVHKNQVIQQKMISLFTNLKALKIMLALVQCHALNELEPDLFAKQHGVGFHSDGELLYYALATAAIQQADFQDSTATELTGIYAEIRCSHLDKSQQDDLILLVLVYMDFHRKGEKAKSIWPLTPKPNQATLSTTAAKITTVVIDALWIKTYCDISRWAIWDFPNKLTDDVADEISTAISALPLHKRTVRRIISANTISAYENLFIYQPGSRSNQKIFDLAPTAVLAFIANKINPNRYQANELRLIAGAVNEDTLLKFQKRGNHLVSILLPDVKAQAHCWKPHNQDPSVFAIGAHDIIDHWPGCTKLSMPARQLIAEMALLLRQKDLALRHTETEYFAEISDYMFMSFFTILANLNEYDRAPVRYLLVTMLANLKFTKQIVEEYLEYAASIDCSANELSFFYLAKKMLDLIEAGKLPRPEFTTPKEWRSIESPVNNELNQLEKSVLKGTRYEAALSDDAPPQVVQYYFSALRETKEIGDRRLLINTGLFDVTQTSTNPEQTPTPNRLSVFY